MIKRFFILCSIMALSHLANAKGDGDSITFRGFPDSILHKSFAKKIIVVDSLQERRFGNDSNAIKQRIHELQKWADSKGDAELRDMFLIAEFRLSMYKGFDAGDVEARLQELIKKNSGTSDEKIRALAYQALAEFYIRSANKMGEALENFLYAYKIYDKYDLSQFPLRGEFLFDIGKEYYYLRDFHTARMYYAEALNLNPKEMVENRISKTNSLGMCYRNSEEYDSAIYYFNVALDYCKTKRDSVWTAIVTGNIAWSHFYKKDYEAALPLFEFNIAEDLKHGMKQDAMLSMAPMMQILVNKGQLDRASALADTCYKLLYGKSRAKDYGNRKTVFTGMAPVYFAKGDLVSAYHFLDSALIATDSLYKQRNIIVLAGVQHRMDVEERMSSLKEKEAEIAREKLLRNMSIVGFILMLAFAVVFFYQRNKIAKERTRSEGLLLNILPTETAAEIKESGYAKAKSFNAVTVMFTDFKNFTVASEKLTPEELVQEIHYCYSQFDAIVSRYGIEKIKTMGDSYMCAAGLPTPKENHAIDMVNCALEIRDFILEEQSRRVAEGRAYFEIRIGVHSGSVVAGIVGIKKFAYDIWGDTVNVASRMESSGEENKVNISGATYELVREDFNCTYRGKIPAKNKGEIDMYFVERK